jgi:molybdenum cofactor cytidylyltransferase
MPRSPSFAGVILAAGQSSRMGRDKALLPWPPPVDGRFSSKSTFLSATIQSLMPFTDFVVVVAGKNEAAIAPVAYAQGASVVVNLDPDRGQFSSLQVGLREVLSRGRDAAIITLVDRPPAAAATVQALRNAFTAAPANIWAVVPEFRGRHGHPYVSGRELIEAFLQAPDSSNARAVEGKHLDHLKYLTVDDPCVTMNINTPADYDVLGDNDANKLR